MKATKSIILALAVCCGLGSCTTGMYSSVNDRISEVPTVPHERDVELYFAGEWPKEEYVKIAALEARGGENTRYAQLILKLKDQAQKHGADAIVIQNKEFISDISAISSSRTISTTTTSELHGIAVKYKKNLDLSRMPKQQQIQVYNAHAQTFEPLLNLHLSYGGAVTSHEELQPDAMKFYNTYAKPYSEYALLHEQNQYWSSHEQKGYITARQLVRNGSILKSVQVEYTPQRQISKITIEEPGAKKEHIDYKYDADGKLTARYIYRDNVLFLQEKYAYSPAGMIEQVKLYTSNEQGEMPLLQSTFAYYTLQEVR